MPAPRRSVSAVLFVASAALVAGAIAGGYKLKRYVDTDPGLCAHCHQTNPEFALWSKGTHRTVACQKCHHSTPEQGLAMLKAFLGRKSEGNARPHGHVEVGACAACHLSHDPQWPQVGGSRGHKIHVEEQKIACVRCHAAGMHGFEPVSATCQSCHGEHRVRALGMQQLHCFACHDFLSRDPGLRPTRRDCLRCHQEKGVLPARFADGAPMQFACGTCHKPHAPTPAEERVACDSCHTQMRRAGLHAARGHERCASCHAAHAWRSERAACLRCHSGAADHAHGAACGGCHGFGGAGKPVLPPPL